VDELPDGLVPEACALKSESCMRKWLVYEEPPAEEDACDDKPVPGPRGSGEDPDRVVPPSERSLLSPCSTSGSERSDLGDLWKTSFLYGLPLADPGPRTVVPSTL
jgi:hypothetical protein